MTKSDYEIQGAKLWSDNADLPVGDSWQAKAMREGYWKASGRHPDMFVAPSLPSRVPHPAAHHIQLLLNDAHIEDNQRRALRLITKAGKLYSKWLSLFTIST